MGCSNTRGADIKVPGSKKEQKDESALSSH